MISCPYKNPNIGDICDNRFEYTMLGAKLADTINGKEIAAKTNLREIQILSEKQAQSMYGTQSKQRSMPSTALISIGAAAHEHEEQGYAIGWNGVVDYIRLHFADICYRPSTRRRKWLISNKTANDAATFLTRLKNVNVERLAIHCGAGISRSAAVAAAASMILWGDDLWCFMRPLAWSPNITAYIKILDALGCIKSANDIHLAYAKHEFAEWAYRGDEWFLESYNVDSRELKKFGIADNIQTNVRYSWSLENNPLAGYKQNPLPEFPVIKS